MSEPGCEWDGKHSRAEERFYCFGLDNEGRGILTVRLTHR
jgi:hypothetical protein